MSEQNRKTLRSFYCRDYLWELFEVMASDLGCSMDYLVNEAMRHYARSRNYSLATGRSQPGSHADFPSAPPPPPPPAVAIPASFPSATPSGYPGANPYQPRGPMSATPPAYDHRYPSQVRPHSYQPQPPPQPPPPPPADYYPPPPAYTPVGGAYESRAAGMASTQAPTASFVAVQPPGSGAGQLHSMPAPPPPPPPPPPAMTPAGAYAGQQPGAGGQPPMFLIFQGQKYRVDKEKFIIGRGSQMTDLTIRDGNISRKHAAVIFRSGKYFIKDLDSTNGIDFQGSRIDSKKIEEGDVFHICDYELRFTYRG